MKHLIFGAIVALVASVGRADEYISPVTGKPVPKDGKLTLEQVYEYGKKVGEPKQTSGKQELYEAIVALYAK